MKVGEIIRIIAFSLVAAALMFIVQPWIYQSRLIFVGIPDASRLQSWVGNYYRTGATIVFAISVISTVLWYVLAARAQPRGGNDVANWSVIWWVILLLPILSIGIALYFYSGIKEALGSLTVFFVFDVLFIYWFTTATNSPRHLKFIPPGASLLRRLVGD